MELNGLRAIIGSTDTLHGIEEPPKREDYDGDAVYASVLDEWYVRMTFWHATVKKEPDSGSAG
jgi:hypothetical protein